MVKDPDIERQMDRVEEIIDQLDADEIALEKGRELHEEGQESLTAIRDRLHESEGDVIEIE